MKKLKISPRGPISNNKSSRNRLDKWKRTNSNGFFPQTERYELLK